MLTIITTGEWVTIAVLTAAMVLLGSGLYALALNWAGEDEEEYFERKEK